MKGKKILMAISSVVLAAAMSATAFTGCNKCEHVYKWTTRKESTCVARGEEEGVCGICGDVTTRKTDVNPDNHVYGEWNIDFPTESKAGNAAKTCTLDNSHVLNVPLPVITANAEGYFSEGNEISEITKLPTAVEEGVFHGILKNDAGDIVFDAPMARREVETVEDAVLLGSSLGSLIRSTGGRVSDSVSGATTRYSDFAVNFGDNYTHVVDEGNGIESWISYDDEGKPFGISKESGKAPAVMENITAKNLLGFGYSSGAEGDNLRTFGAEDTLLSYYNRVKLADEKGRAVKYSEEIMKNSDGGVVAEFEYSYFDVPFFARYHLEFSLYPNGAIKTLTLTTKIIRQYMIATDAYGELLFDDDGDVIFAEEYASDPNTNAPLYERDAEGKIVYEGVKTDKDGNILHDRRGEEIPRPKPQAGTKTGFYSNDHSEVSTRVLIYNEQVLKTENDEVEENPYKSDVLYISSFDVTYNGGVIGGEGVTVPSNTAVNFGVSNIAPSTATLDYDPLGVYIRTDMRDIELTMNFNDNTYNVIGYFNKGSKTVQINSRYAGDLLLVLKTKGGKTEKEIKVHFDKGAPSTINAQAYTYSDAGGNITYTWAPYNINSTLTLYVGQSLYVRAVADSSEAGYADTSFIASCLEEDSEYFEIENDVDFNGEKVSVVTPIKAGSNRIYLEYTKTNAGSSPLTGFVIEAVTPPEVSSLFRGEYSTTLRYVKVGGDIRQADVKAVFDHGNNWRKGTIKLTVGNDTFDYEYTYDEATKQINVSGGINEETYDFTFAVNEAYRITITHSTGFLDITETMALLPVVNAE